MSDEKARTRCIALTRLGEPCKNLALADSEYCRVHQPASQEDKQAIPDEEMRRQLVAELDQLIERVRALAPDYTPAPLKPERLPSLIEENLGQISPELRLGILKRLREAIGENLFDLETWKGIWFLLDYAVKHQADIVKRRFTGEYETDEWGLDWEFLETVIPFFNFFYNVYWRVETSGIDNIPDYGRALLVCNHSSQLPVDGLMVGMAVWNEHPSQRLVRNLYASWLPKLPFLSSMLVKLGHTLASVENGTRLLEQEELVAVYPEGDKERHQLARLGRGGFVKMALNTQAPIIPVAVVGAEEAYVPTFPWLRLLGLVPLPTKWYIDFGGPIPMDTYGPEAANNLMLISQLTDQVRDVVQGMVNARLAERRSVFLG